MVKWIVGIVVVGLLIAATVLFDDEKPDVVSSATVVSSKVVQMPKKSKDYKTYQVAGLVNFLVAYSPNFTRGGMIETIEGMEALKKRGIKTIVSIVPSSQEKAMAEQYGLKLVEIPFTNEVIKPEDLQAFKKVLDDNEPIYVHCHGGIHRAGVLGLYYRLWSGWDFSRARDEFIALGGYPLKDKPLLDIVEKSEFNHDHK